MPRSEQIIFSVTCDRVGKIQRVLRDDFNVLVNLATNANLRDIVDEAGSSKVWRFLEELAREKAAADWTFNIPVEGKLLTLHFAGGTHDDYLVIVAATTRENMQLYYDELMQISNEHANSLRAALKDKALLARQEEIPRNLYQEMMALNNELTNTQRELAKRNTELAKLNAEKNRFLGMAAHDLRTPLNVIFGYGELLRDEWDSVSSAERIEILDKISTSGRYMLSLVDGFLDYTKIESGTLQLNPQAASIAEVADVAIDQVIPLADAKQIQINFTPSDNLPAVALDVHRMNQVMLNLLTNAIKYSPSGTTTQVTITSTSNKIRVEVKDEGPGIPREELGKLFHPFTRTSVKSTAGEKSTGMGLLIVKRIVEAHHGTLGVQSTVGKGSTFWFELPLGS